MRPIKKQIAEIIIGYHKPSKYGFSNGKEYHCFAAIVFASLALEAKYTATAGNKPPNTPFPMW